MGRRLKFKSREDLFNHILKEWYNDEKQILSEWGIGNRDLSRKILKEEYERYQKAWKDLGGNE